jgi:hypothetical protein
MRTWTRTTAARILLLAAATGLGAAAGAGAAEHRIGVGQLYWRSLDDLGELNLEDDGAATYLSYQYVPEGIFKVEVDLEYYSQGFAGSTSAAYSPVLFLLAEFGLYGGLGVGVTVSDGLTDNISDPFYAARLGWDFQLLPRLHLDVNANYRAGTFQELRDYDQDSITLGAAARVAF